MTARTIPVDYRPPESLEDADLRAEILRDQIGSIAARIKELRRVPGRADELTRAQQARVWKYRELLLVRAWIDDERDRLGVAVDREGSAIGLLLRAYHTLRTLDRELEDGLTADERALIEAIEAHLTHRGLIA